MTTDNERERAAAEAARWLIALEEHPADEALRSRFDAWLDATPSNAKAWADTSDIYDMMAKTKPAHAEHWAPYAANPASDGSELSSAPIPGPARTLTGTTHRPMRRPMRRRIALGAITALAACMAIAIAPSIALRIQADHTTATGETRSIGLDDGSVAHLQPDSAITIDFDGTERRVRIVKGGAFFEVAHDPSLPFRVAARKVTTTVLGTAFDVRLTEDDTSVAVRQGRVGVARPPKREQLTPGDWIRIDREGSVRRGTVPPDEVGAWMDRQLIARDRPLADVMEELGGYYGGMIVLTSDALGNRRVSGVYNLGDPVGALRAMASAHGGVVRQISPWLVVISDG